MHKIIIPIFVLLAIFISCEKDKSLLPGSETILNINFTHTVNNENFTLCCNINYDSLSFKNSANEEYNIQRLSYLLSNISLHDNEGNIELIKEVHFVDVSNDETLDFNIYNIENKNYTYISFTMGLDTLKNKDNYYINNNQGFHSSMFWPTAMGGGYHYMKLEGDFDTITQGYATHTGASMGMDNSFSNVFPISFDENEDRLSVNINMEINNWYNNPNIINLEASIMNNVQKQIQLKENGKQDVFSVSSN